MNFAGTEVKNPFFLAPMAGVTDSAFRTVCVRHGAALTYTEMVSAAALVHDDRKTEELLHIQDAHMPCFAQIFGGDPDTAARGAEKVEIICKASGIDINMGCPMPKIVKNGDGSALMRDPDKVYGIVRAVKNAVALPVTVKIRAGTDSRHINAVEVALAAESAGASAIGVHGRTAEQLYAGKSSREIVSAVKKAVRVPVIASGDILTAQDAVGVMSETGADFVMIARGARGNPFIFDQCIALFNNEEIKDPTAEELMRDLFFQAKLACEEKGEARAMPEMRKHALWYLARIRGGRPFKLRASMIKSLSELSEICGEVGRL